MPGGNLSKLLIRHGRIIDPANQTDMVADLLIEDHKIARIEKSIKNPGSETIDAADMIVAPGLIDLHTHLRDPGRPDEETIASGTAAAIAGGFTSICCMPNTEPPIDNEGIINYIIKEAERADRCRVFPIAAITKGRKGKEITEFGTLLRAGARAFSDDGDTVANARILRHAFEYSRAFDCAIFEHALDADLARDGQMNEGVVSTMLGLDGSPGVAEEVIVARDIILARFTGARLHVCHVSTRGAIALIRQAKQEGVRVTCETCPHYFHFNDEDLKGYDPNLKVNPPIRTEDDRQAVIQGLKDGTIDCIATDHAPHSLAEKELEFANAPFGMIGLETAVPLVTMTLVDKANFAWPGVIAAMTSHPASILGEPLGRLTPGAVADVTIIDPKRTWRVARNELHSLSHNTPLLNKELTGRVVCTIVNGVVKHRLP